MSLWSRLTGGRETKASAAGQVISAWNVGQPVWTPRRYDKLSDEAYVRNAVAYRCVKTIASAAASIPWLLYGKGGVEIEEHAILSLLAKPGPGVSGEALTEALIAYLLLAGNSYLEGVGPNDKAPPKELWALRPDRTSIIAGPYGLPQGFQYEASGIKKTWQVDPITGVGPILHLKEFHPTNDWYGLARVDPAAYAIDRHNAASAHNKALLDNGARPSGALIFKPVIVNGQAQSAPQPIIDAAETRLNERHVGTKGAGKPFVFGGDVDWKEMGLSPRDMDFAASKDDSARDICIAFGVPHLLIVPGSATYNNVREAKLELYEDTVLPLAGRLASALNAWLTPRYGDGLRLEHDLDEVSALEPRRESKRKSVVELLTAGVIDADEARDALQYGPRKSDAVKKIDASVLTALVAAAEKDSALFEPLLRYMRSTGLVEPGTTAEQLLESARALIGVAEEEDETGGETTPGSVEDEDEGA